LEDTYRIDRFDAAALLLPWRIRERARRLMRGQRSSAEEFRLRVGQVPTVLLPEGEVPLGTDLVTREDLDGLVELATRASMHTAQSALCRGYVTVQGGFRLGLCGTAVTQAGRITGLRTLSSAALRIAREIRGAAEPVLDTVMEDGVFPSCLILSPPGGGKTTLLRDMIRLLSDRYRYRISVADERCEIAAMWEGRPGMEVGRYTDVLEDCPKAEGAMALLRAMNPRILAMDEITEPEDIRALLSAAGCGVKLLATAHGDTEEDLYRRPIYRPIMEGGVFEKVIQVTVREGIRHYEIREMEQMPCFALRERFF